jgi:hypothetical protein
MRRLRVRPSWISSEARGRLTPTASRPSAPHSRRPAWNSPMGTRPGCGFGRRRDDAQAIVAGGFESGRSGPSLSGPAERQTAEVHPTPGEIRIPHSKGPLRASSRLCRTPLWRPRRAQPCQGWGRGFESLRPLQGLQALRWHSPSATGGTEVHRAAHSGTPIGTLLTQAAGYSCSGVRAVRLDEAAHRRPFARGPLHPSIDLPPSPARWSGPAPVAASDAAWLGDGPHGPHERPASRPDSSAAERSRERRRHGRTDSGSGR